MKHLRNQSRIPEFLFASAFFVIAAAWATSLVLDGWASVHDANAAYQKNAEDERAKSAVEVAQACNNLPFDEFRQCVLTNLESHYQKQATNEDLQAQQDMAYWAMLLLIVSVVGVVVSTGGVVLLIATIQQGRLGLDRATDAIKAAQDANDIMRQQDAGYIIVEKVELQVQDNMLLVLGTVRNIGKRPVRLAKIHGELRFNWISVSDGRFGPPGNATTEIELFAGVVEPGKSMTGIQVVSWTKLVTDVSDFDEYIRGNTWVDFHCDVDWVNEFAPATSERHLMHPMAGDGIFRGEEEVITLEVG